MIDYRDNGRASESPGSRTAPPLKTPRATEHEVTIHNSDTVPAPKTPSENDVVKPSTDPGYFFIYVISFIKCQCLFIATVSLQVLNITVQFQCRLKRHYNKQSLVLLIAQKCVLWINILWLVAQPSSYRLFSTLPPCWEISHRRLFYELNMNIIMNMSQHDWYWRYTPPKSSLQYSAGSLCDCDFNVSWKQYCPALQLLLTRKK